MSHDDLLKEEFSWQANAEVQKDFARLAGLEGQQSWKVLRIINHADAEPDDEDD